jgi:hypothetical protein
LSTSSKAKIAESGSAQNLGEAKPGEPTLNKNPSDPAKASGGRLSSRQQSRASETKASQKGAKEKEESDAEPVQKKRPQPLKAGSRREEARRSGQGSLRRSTQSPTSPPAKPQPKMRFEAGKGKQAMKGKGDKNGLAQEYPSFDLLWFDIETRCRRLLQELMDPVMDKMIDNTQDIDLLKKDHISSAEKIEEIKDTIFETNGKLDVFEQINVKLAEMKADVMTVEEQIKHQVKVLNLKMTEVSDRADADHSKFKLLADQCSDVMGELSQLKESYQKQSDIFVYEVQHCNKLINDHAHELTTHCNRLDQMTDDHFQRLENHTNLLQELQGRTTIAEKNISRHEEEIQRIQVLKTDNKTFLRAKKKLELQDL